MLANKLGKHGTIGIICPSHVADIQRYEIIVQQLEQLGYQVKLGENIQKATFGYAASGAERAADLNRFVADDQVELILFSGGEGAAEILPFIDYDNIRKHPKLFSSYSDGTSILNAIYAQTGLVTYYGCGAGEFLDLRYYDYRNFQAYFQEETPESFLKGSSWKSLCSGVGEGILIGGYTALFALMLGNTYFHRDQDANYILFLEDHESFSSPAIVATYLAFIEQSEFIKQIKGLVFGHFSMNVPTDLWGVLERFGERQQIPVVYTDDFGHGKKHGILPIGMKARLDGANPGLVYLP